VLAICNELARCKMKLYPYCAARTHPNDIKPIIEIQQRSGIKVQAALFIFSSPIRQFAEDWTVDRMLKVSEEAVEFAHKNDVPVMYVTEDTTRSRPETLERLYGMAIDHDVERLCISDTVGHATPPGAEAVVRFVCAAWWKNRARTSASTGTATATAISAWPTRSRRTWPARIACTAPCSASASVSAIRPSTCSW
jgi:isopropylmalate/homocitrate/citramalate synthase